MKLLDKYNRINLLSTIAIFLLSVVAFYFVLHYTLVHQLDDDLEIEQHEIVAHVQQNNSLPTPIEMSDQQISFKQTGKPVSGRIFQSIDVTHKEHKRERELLFSIDVAGHWYDVSIKKSMEGIDNIIRSVVLITLCTIVLILMATFIINRKIFKTLWRPFYESLDAFKDFKIGGGEKLEFPKSDIDEFTLLNHTLKQTTGKALQDYKSLKQFTENASHELQTPLAIIRSKLEVLVQGDNLSEQQSLAVQGANDAINKLSRLNQSLLLLTKIENKQFGSTININVKDVVENSLDQFKEIWEHKALNVTATLNDTIVLINKELLDILIINLLSNATKHNYTGGGIHIGLSNSTLTISNTSKTGPLDQEKLFQRFYNPNNNKDSHGLGLAIIQQVCDASAISIVYAFQKDGHVFRIDFNRMTA